jgi:hypothetical protein
MPLGHAPISTVPISTLGGAAGVAGVAGVTLSVPGVAAMALVAAPGIGAFSALGPAVSGVLVQGARGVVFVPLAAPGASGVSGEGSGLVGGAEAIVDFDGVDSTSLAAALLAEVGAEVDAALLEACRIVGELETAELHWHGTARNAKARFKLILRAAAWTAIPASRPGAILRARASGASIPASATLCILRAGFPRLRVGRG